MNRKNTKLQDQTLGFPVRFSAGYSLTETKVSSSANKCRQSRVDSEIKRKNKIGKRAFTFANAVRSHDKLGPKISETVKRKLSYGAKILQAGGINRVFKRLFTIKEEERLMNAFQCYLSTTAGPIAGLLFISTEKIAFCSERSMEMASPNGETVRVHYKVSIPLSKIKRAEQSEDLKNASKKYVEIVTVDEFEFWFMGFSNPRKAFGFLQQAVCRGFR